MKTLVIKYVEHVGQSYHALYAEIMKTEGYCHAMKGCWFVTTSENAAQLRDRLWPKMYKNDELFVGVLSGQAAWIGLPVAASNWLKLHLEKYALS